jgi:acyl-CoA synthetase (AMP-forming)/AMP-acid ligase II/thioesterase domain-containing protein
MKELIDRLVKLSPAKRALAFRKLREAGERYNCLPLSFAQQRLWFVQQLDTGSVAYNIPLAFELRGKLDHRALERSFTEILRRQEVLRTTFLDLDGEPMQVVWPEIDFALERVDLAVLDAGQQDHALRERMMQQRQRPFDLARGPIFTAMLVGLAPERHVLSLVIHHIAADGWSLGVLFDELATCYSAFADGRAPALPALEIQYADFSTWQRDELGGQRWEERMDEWRTELAGAPTVLDLPADRPRQERSSHLGARHLFEVPGETRANLERLCRETRATLFMGLLAGFTTLLHRYTGQEDILVGTPVANRDRAALERLVGFFANTLPLRSRYQGAASFRRHLERIRDSTVAAYARQMLPFESIVEAVQPERHLARNPLVQVAFALQNAPASVAAFGNLELLPHKLELETVRFDLELHVWETEGALRGASVYDTALFDSATISALSRSFVQLLAAAAADPELPIQQLPLVSPVEPARGAPAPDVDPRASLLDAIAAQAERAPHALALTAAGADVTYGQLLAAARACASRLASLGVAPGCRLGVCLEPEPRLASVVLGALLCGAAVLVLDPRDPRERSRRRACSAALQFLVHEDDPAGDWERVQTIPRAALEHATGAASPLPALSPSSPAYLAVAGADVFALSHRTLARRAAALDEICPLAPSDRILVASPLSEERYLSELVWPLSRGACVVFLRQQDSSPLLVPPAVTIVAAGAWDECPVLGTAGALRRVLLRAGAMEAGRLWQLAARLGCQVVNAVEVPQAGVACLWRAADDPPGFRPLAAAGVDILDEKHQPLPAGAAGTLHIRIERGEASPSPVFSAGARARARSDGTIELLPAPHAHGWLDGRQCVNEEIEATLLESEAIEDCAVLLRRAAGSHELVAYVVASRRMPGDQELRDDLARVLPSALLPRAFVPVTTIPRDARGRLDVRALERLPVIDSAVCTAVERALRAAGAGDAGCAHVKRQEQRPDIRVPRFAAPARPASAGKAPVVVSGGASALLERPALAEGPRLALDPDGPQTLADCLHRAAASKPDHGVLYLGPGGIVRQSYPQLVEDARRIGCGLRRRNLQPGALVLFQLDGAEHFLSTFWGCALAGLVPVPLAPAWSQPGNAARLATVWQFLDAPPVVTSRADHAALQDVAREHGLALSPMIVEELLATEPGALHADTSSDDLALLLLTSGSTGLPKAVTQTHRALLCRSRAYALHDHASADDVIFNWMPLDHVGGLVMMSLQAVYLGATQVQAPMPAILAEPLRWLDGLAQTRATVSWAPNFAFGLINDHADEIRRGRWDLGAVRRLQNGGEAVVARSARRFLELLEPHGLRPDAIGPAWGMSETCSGVTYERSFTRATTSDEQPHVSVGEPVPGASLRIVDDRGEPLREGQTGQLEVHGVMVTRGYLRNDEQNRESFTADGWFRTGDLAVLQNGKLTITGRAKDVIIINGINYAAHEIESIVEELAEVQPSFTAACSVRSPGSDTDELAVFFAPERPDRASLRVLLPRIRSHVARRLGVSPRHLLALEPSQIPKTGIGKLQRPQLRQRLESGELDALRAEMDLLLGGVDTVPAWFYRRVWSPRPVVRSFHRSRLRILLFSSHSALSSALQDALLAQGHRVITVEQATAGFEQHAGDRYSIRPDCPEDHRELVQRAGDAPGGIDEIIYLWSHGNATLHEPDLLAPGALGVLHVVQALERVRVDGRRAGLLVVSSGAQMVHDGEEVVAGRAILLGLMRTIALEFPWLRSGHLDLAVEDATSAVTHILSELDAAQRPTELAIRDHGRLISRIEPVDPTSLATPAVPALEPGALVLVAGGLGDIGKMLVLHLVERYGVTPILIGRTPLPPRESFAQVLTEDSRLAARVRSWIEIERLSAEARYHALDIADAAALEAVVADVEARTGCRLRAMFQLAGGKDISAHWSELDRHRLVHLDRRGLEDALGAKVAGTTALSSLARSRPDLLFVLFSSVYGAFGSATFGGYVMANAFLEGMARQGIPHGRTCCIHWALWNRTGMSTDVPEAVIEGTRASGYHVLSAREALASLDIALHHHQQEVLVGIDEQRFPAGKIARPDRTGEEIHGYAVAPDGMSQPAQVHDRYGTPVPYQPVLVPSIARDANGMVVAGASGAPTPGGEAPFAEPQGDLEHRIAALWADVLGVRRVGRHDDFFDLGGHSLLAMKLVARLKSVIGKEVSPATLFQGRTVARLCQALSMGSLGSGGVVPLNTGPTSATPLFLVHPAGGAVFSYVPLARRLEKERQLVGIQAPAFDGGPDDWSKSIERTASRYLTLVRETRATGPYIIGGWSFGGVVAYEMARQLRGLDTAEDIHLVLIDAIPALTEVPVIDDAAALAACLGMELPSSVGPSSIQAVLDAARATGSVPETFDEDGARRLVHVYRVQAEALARYQPPAFEGEALLIEAQDGLARVRGSLEALWRPLCRQLTVERLPGNHFALMESPLVERLAQRIQDYLASARRPGQ